MFDQLKNLLNMDRDDDYDDNYDDDFVDSDFDDDDDDDYDDYSPAKSVKKYTSSTSSYQPKAASKSNKVVSFSNRSSSASSYHRDISINGEVYVIKPQGADDTQTIINALKQKKTIVLNMEGIAFADAQRIIDYVAGACYAINGTIKSVSEEIFIAVPESVEINGDYIGAEYEGMYD